MLQVENLSGGYDGKEIVKNVSFHVDQGEVLGILGPNGSGKSTLLKLISQILTPTQGHVHINGKLAEKFSAKSFAKEVAVLPQLHAHAFSHTVRETVELGRYPHQTGLFSSWTKEDETAVCKALKSTGVERYEKTSIELLSGGEQQRVFVAQALAQEAPILLLDEPTNHLDIAHQQQLLDMIRETAKDAGKTVVSVFHDINLASLYCDRLLLMKDGQVEHIGPPTDVINEKSIDEVYHARIKTQPHPERPTPQITLMANLTEIENASMLKIEDFSMSQEYVSFQSNQPLKTLSSAVHNAGMGWYRYFVNRHVDKNYYADDVGEEMSSYLTEHQFSLTETVGMMTAALTEQVVLKRYANEAASIIVAVTAGLGNATDVSKAYERDYGPVDIGTVNTWVFIEGTLPDEAFIQAIVTATEAKTKAFQTEGVEDAISKTIATGTSTDSVLIAATQTGKTCPYAGPIAPLGQLIAHGVFNCTTEAIRKYHLAQEQK